MDALRGVTREDLEHRFANAFRERTGKGPERTTIVECEDLLVIRADGTLTKTQEMLSTRDPGLATEISRAMLDDLAHKQLWEAAEALSGHPVTAVLADQSCDPDVAVVCFVLDRSGGGRG